MSNDRTPFKLPHEINLASALAPTYRPKHFFLDLPGIMRLPPADWLVKGLFPSDGLGVVYGRPGAGKTFFLLANALSIGHGMACFNRTAVKGNVAIVEAEGSNGLQNRIRAWHEFHGLDWSQCPSVRVLPRPVDMLDADGTERLILDIHHLFGGEPIALVIIDTMARCFGDGDENRQPDMARFISGCELVRHTFHCAVCVVHHTPKDSDELRGSSALEGAADFVIRIGKSETGREAFVRKMKDGKDNITFGFRMESQNIGQDADGDAVLTPVAVLDGDERVGVAPSSEAVPTGKNQTAVLAVLVAAGTAGLSNDEWRDASKAAKAVGGGNPPRAFRDARDALLRDGLVLVEGDRYFAA